MSEKMLSVDDVQRLMSDQSGQARAETANKLAQHFDTTRLSESERKIAEDIFRLMVQDAEVRVREALSSNLKENPLVPHDIAVALARDVGAVSLPMLEFSKVLTTADLVEIVQARDPEKQIAIARRETVDEVLSGALVEDGTAAVAVTLAGNAGAAISDASLNRMVDRFGDEEALHGPLVHRARLPVTVAERLVHRVSEQLQDHILRSHELPPDLAADLVMQSRERATITLSTESDEDQVEALIRQMDEHGRLTPSIILRALCMGDLKFFEYAMARRTNVPVVNARILIHDDGALGLQAIYKRAKLPENFYPAFRAALDVAHETDYDGGEQDRERYSRRMLERVLTQYGDLGVTFESADLEYLMTKMGQLPATHI